MTKTRAYIAIIAFLALAAVLLSLWLEGGLSQETNIPKNIRKEVEENGIIAELNVQPEAAILPGDVLTISADIFYNRDAFSVNAKKLAEEYVEFKEKRLAGCEERTPAKLEEKNEKGIGKIRLDAQFQCWITESHETSLSLPIQYTNTKVSQTSTLYVSKKISFATLAKSNEPKGLVQYSESQNRLWVWLIVMGNGVTALATVFLVLTLMKRGKLPLLSSKNSAGDYYFFILQNIKETLNVNPRSAYDKLFHLCCKIEAEIETSSPRILAMKKKVLALYGAKINPKQIEELIREFETLIQSGGWHK